MTIRKLRPSHSLVFFTSSSSLPLRSLEMADTEGTVVLSHTPSLISRSRISQLYTPSELGEEGEEERGGERRGEEGRGE